MAATDESLLIRNIARFLWEGLTAGEGAVMIATPEHREAVAQRLGESGRRAEVNGSLVYRDANETLRSFLVSGQPHAARFDAAMHALLDGITERTGRVHFRAYGEMVGVLWQAGQRDAAIRLEELWNALLDRRPVQLFCGYPISVFGPDFQIASIDSVMCEHGEILPSGERTSLERALDRAMHEVLGHRYEGLRPLIRANYRPAWGDLPTAEARILWLRNNLPEHASSILERAQSYYKTSA